MENKINNYISPERNFMRKHKYNSFFLSDIIPQNEAEYRNNVKKDLNIEAIGLDFEYDAKNNVILSMQVSRYNHDARRTMGVYITDLPEKITSSYIRKVAGVDKDTHMRILAHYSPAEMSCIDDLKEFIAEESTKHINKGKWMNLYNREKNLSYVDTMGFDRVSLEEGGKSLGIEKVDLQKLLLEADPEYWKHKKGIEAYNEVIKRHPEIAKKYGMQDAYIVLEWWYTMGYMLNKDLESVKENEKVVIADSTPALAEKLARTRVRAYLKSFAKTHGKDVSKNLIRNVFGLSEDASGNTYLSVVSTGYGALAYSGGKNKVLFSGIVKCSVKDIDLIGAYPTAITLIRAVDLERPIKHSMNSAKKLSRAEDWIERQGWVKATINFKPSIRSAPIGVKVIDSLIETYENQNARTTLVTFLSILRNYREHVNWSASTVHEIVEYPPILVDGKPIYPFRDMINEQLAKRAQAKARGDKRADKFHKNVLVSIYGKMAQGVSNQVMLNHITKEYEMKPYSTIFNGLYAAFITDIVRMLVTEAVNAAGDYALNVVTDGFMVANPSNLSNEEILGFYENQDIAKAFKKSANKDKIWEVKGDMPYGCLVIKVRVDAALEANFDDPNATPKYAKHGAMSSNMSKRDGCKLLFYRFTTPEARNEPLHTIRLQGIKDVLKGDNGVLQSKTLTTHMDLNISTSMAPWKLVNNEHMSGVMFKPHNTIQSYKRVNAVVKSKPNEYVAYDVEAMKEAIKLAAMKSKWTVGDTMDESIAKGLLAMVANNEFRRKKHIGLYARFSYEIATNVLQLQVPSASWWRSTKSTIKKDANLGAIPYGDEKYFRVHNAYRRLKGHLANMLEI